MSAFVRNSVLAAVVFIGSIAAAPHEAATKNQAAIDAYNQGVEAYNAKRWPAAIDAYTRAAKLDPSFAAAYRNRGTAYQGASQYSAAIADYTTALQLDPSDEAIYVYRGWARSASGNAYNRPADYDAALADAIKALSMDPSDASAYILRGRSLYGLGRYAEALTALGKGIALDPHDVDGYNFRSLVYLDTCRNVAGITDLTSAITIGDTSTFRNNRGIAYLRTHTYDMALADFTQAIALDPKSAEPHLNRGLYYVHVKDYALARADYDASIALDPMSSIGYLDRALLFERQKRYIAALSDINYAIQKGPERIDARIDAGGPIGISEAGGANLYRIRADIFTALGRPDVAKLDLATAGKTKAAKTKCPTGV